MTPDHHSPSPAPGQMERALTAFHHGFSFTRSRTHPYLVEQVEGLTVLRDAPRRRGDYRVEEWTCWGVPATEVDRIVRANTRGRFAICAMCSVRESIEALRDEFKALGYRLGRTEPLMVNRLEGLPQFECEAAIERVNSVELAETLSKANGLKPLRAEFFGADSRLRQYVALLDGEAVGWVGSIALGDLTWCSSMFVEPEYRRRGIARALLSRMLADDLASGSRLAVLLASHAGAKLYPVVGYEQIGTLLLLTPKVR